MDYNERIPRDALVKESRKFALLIEASNSAEDIWKQLPEKNREKLFKEYCTIRGKGLERLVGKWLEEKGLKIYLNQKIKGEERTHEIDVVAVKENMIFSDNVWLIECKGTKSKVSDKIIVGTIDAFKDIVDTGETKFGEIEGLAIISSSGFSQSAINKIKRINEEGTLNTGIMTSTFHPELWEYFGGKFKFITGKKSDSIKEYFK